MSNKVNPYGSAPTHHMLSVLVQNRPGVLARVASLFARRGYNIYSLAVAPTEQDDFSRITIVVDVESAPLEQIVKQLFKAFRLNPHTKCVFVYNKYVIVGIITIFGDAIIITCKFCR